MVKLQCSISAQDCATLFSPSTTLHKLPYSTGSCVRDDRLTGNIGRCGFPGATCVTDALGNDNCAYGGDSTVPNYKPLCRNGICGGGLGAKCSNGDYDCNWGYYCNTTASSGIVGVCGGYNAFADSQGDTGVDFAFDYCLSGKATQSASGAWYCTAETAITVTSNSTSSSVILPGVSTVISTLGGTTTLAQTVTVIGSLTRTISSVQSGLLSSSSSGPIITSLSDGGGSKHHSNTGLIAGVVAAAVVVVILLIVILFLWRRSRGNNRPAASQQSNQTSPFSHSGYTTEPLLGLPSNGLTPSPSPQMQQMTGSTTPSFPNTANYPTPPTFTYLPEIQADSNAGGRQSYPNNTVPGGYSSTVLPNTPSSPAFAYGSSTGSSPAVSPSPYATSFGSSGATNNTQYVPVDGGNRDATERHLLAARMDAERELAQMRWPVDGRDATQ